MRLAIAALIALQAGACATITRGTTEQVGFQSSPDGAEVRLSTGQSCVATPCAIEVPRKDPFIATISKPGYRTEQVTVGTTVQGGGAAGLVGNAVVGGIVGVVVDASSGASLDHQPNPVIVTLQPLRPVSPLLERRKRRATS